MRSGLSLAVVGILIGWGPIPPTVNAGPTKIEAEGTLVSIPAGKTRRVGIKNTEGTVWLATPSANGNYLARQVFHRLRRLPVGAYVKVRGVLLSTDPMKIGPQEIKSGSGGEVLTLDVAKDGKSATWAGQPVRLHPMSSIPVNAPDDEQPIKRALLNQVKGKRIQVKAFAFKDRSGVPTDVFLDTVQATVPQASPLSSYADMKTGKRKVLQDLPANAQVWVSQVEGDHARSRYEVQTSPKSTSSHGGWVKLSKLRFAVPKPPKGAAKKGAEGNLTGLPN